jgi:hypothetical protein
MDKRMQQLLNQKIALLKNNLPSQDFDKKNNIRKIKLNFKVFKCYKNTKKLEIFYVFIIFRKLLGSPG